MSRPISKKLLIHSCTVLHVTGQDRDGNKTTEETELQNVRVDIVKGYVQQQAGETKADVLTLFFDCVNSSPAGFIPQELDGLIFEGRRYQLRNVRPCYTMGTNAVHHYEAGLV